MDSLSLFYKIDRMHSFETCPPEEDSTFIIRYSIFIRLGRIRIFRVSF
ncbi:hypothetical protein D1BOALGB6SA_7674 [Olavius sp. associated proteobacterium Delta 1]|nr:hypothetical protein D1BOALGB6SA_7674 [Olavius sp. associated proteobacterium Delta 1]